MFPDKLGLVSLLILMWNALGSLEGGSFEASLRPGNPVKPSISTALRCTHGLSLVPSPTRAVLVNSRVIIPVLPMASPVSAGVGLVKLFGQG